MMRMSYHAYVIMYYTIHLLIYTYCMCLQCKEFVKQGALKANSPAEVVQMCDITYSCVSDPGALKDVSNTFLKTRKQSLY